MQRLRRRSTWLAASVAGAALCSAAPASAAIAYTPCAHTNNFACARVKVALDPSGVMPGTVTLAVRRHRAAIGEARSAIVALAGGPGQSAIPFAEDFAELLGPVAATRDLIVFDQRGTGESGALSCKAFRRLAATPSPQAIETCAAQLGASRTFYGTSASVADIEAIRKAGGYEKLVLYGTSYGTKVAEQYAQAYPQHVEALVLDSVVPPGGPEPLNRSSFSAVPRLVREICAQHACSQVTNDPVRDLARVLSRIHGGGLHARVIGPTGRSRRFAISAQGILGALLDGDFSGALRAALVSTVRSAADGDNAPLARLLATIPSEEGESEGIDVPLYYATSCEDQAFPWSRAASPQQRLSQARAAARALGANAFAPFDAADALTLSDIPACAYWPFTTPFAAVSSAPLPGVPTLILSGAEDMRTPTSNAREVAASIPGSHVLVVPHVGHSVLGSDSSGCAAAALQALFASRPIAACRAQKALQARLRPPPTAPRRVSALQPLHGYRGLPGRTARAVQLTLTDLARQIALKIETSSDIEALLAQPTLGVGGLRSGWAKLSGGGVSFHDYSYVPGMLISGTLRAETADMRIAGPGVAAGTLRLGPHHTLVGTLGGLRVRLAASEERAAAIVGSDAATRQAFGSDGAARGAAVELLARRLERVFDA